MHSICNANTRLLQYAAGLPYGTHYTHVCAAFIASFLIRIARFFPDEMDLPRVAADVEEMAAVLSKRELRIHLVCFTS